MTLGLWTLDLGLTICMLPPYFQTDITTMATGSLSLPAQLVRRSGELVSTEQVRVSLMASPSCDTVH